MILTIETDPRTPFCDPHVPAAEWVYDSLRRGLLRSPSPAAHLAAYLGVVGDRTGCHYRTLPAFPAGASLRSVSARVNHGRWLWDCLTDGCGEAQVCSPVDPRAFCVGCFNTGDGWWPVVFPDGRDQIETLLARRPDPGSRNWTPGETILSLQVENLAHGIDPDLLGQPLVNGAGMLAQVRHGAAIEAGYRPALEA